MDAHRAKSSAPLFLIPLMMSCAWAAPAPQGFAYSTTTFQHPFAAFPFGFTRQFHHPAAVITPAASVAPVTPVQAAPYHFLPATLPQAIYSEPSHILSGYSYQTVDPAGAKSQVLFVSGPNSQQLFRQNANLLHIVLPPLFTDQGDNAIPQSEEEGEGESIAVSPVAGSDGPQTPVAESSAEATASEEITGSSPDDTNILADDNSNVESRAEELATEKKEQTAHLDSDNKEDGGKSSEVQENATATPVKSDDNAKDSDDVKSDDASASETSNAAKQETGESAHTETPSEKDDASGEKDDSEKSSAEDKKSENESTESSVTTTAAE